MNWPQPKNPTKQCDGTYWCRDRNGCRALCVNWAEKVQQALKAGMDAMEDPEIEKAVGEYFQKNPTYSRDAIAVAAQAVRLKREKEANAHA